MPSYDFILGDAGSGKSRNIYTGLSHEAYLHPDRHYYLFVPEQNTLKVQRGIAELSERHGMLNLDVLSFQLLFYRVLEELGIDNVSVLDDITESLLIRKAALDADKAGELTLYRGKLRYRGFIEELKEIIVEFSRYRIDDETLGVIIGRLDERELKTKLSEIRSVYRRFRDLLGSGRAIPEEAPEILLRYINGSHILDGAVIVFDGFMDFQPVQTEIIKIILSKAKRVSFTFTLPESEDPFSFKAEATADLWWLTKKSIAGIVDAASAAGVRMAERPIYYVHRESPDRNIIIHEAHDPTAEIRAIAERIREQALSRGVRYKKMALIVSDMGTYREIIRREFSAAGIPFFMDHRAKALGSPGVELIRAALSAVLSSYRYTELMRYLKNPLFSQDSDAKTETDEYDNLLRKCGFRGRKAVSHLTEESGAERIAAALKPLFTLDDRLKTSVTLKDMADATLSFMEEAGLSGRLDTHAKRLLGAGLTQEAEDGLRFSELTRELIGRVAELLPDVSSSAEEYVELLEAGFADLAGGVIPETMDMVVIGDLRRSRIESISALYIVGANEGLLPSAGRSGGLLNEYERFLLRSLSENLPEGERFEIAPDERIESALSYFYLYMMTHKPEEELFISYSLSGRDGARLWPSRVISEIRERAARVSFDDDAPAALPAAASAKLRPAARLPRLAADTALSLYGVKPGISVSRLETYAACPYSHFLRHGLKLKEREKFDIEAVDIGNLYHSALDTLWREGPVTELSDEELAGAAEHAADLAIAEYRDNVMSLNQKHRYIAASLRRTLIKTARVIRDQLSRGDFRTFGTEINYRHEEEGFILSGKIDRIDVAEGTDTTFVNVIDYKSSDKGFDEALTRAGIDMQLSFYMENALREVRLRMKKGEAAPGGMFFYHVSDPVIDYKKTRASDPDTVRAEALRLRGVSVDSSEYLRHMDSEAAKEGDTKSNLVVKPGQLKLSPEEFSSLTASSTSLMRDFVEEIKGGDIRVSPYQYGRKTGCDYCRYRGSCGFDLKKGDRYRWIAPIKRDGKSS